MKRSNEVGERGMKPLTRHRTDDLGPCDGKCHRMAPVLILAPHNPGEGGVGKPRPGHGDQAGIGLDHGQWPQSQEVEGMGPDSPRFDEILNVYLIDEGISSSRRDAVVVNLETGPIV